MSLCVVRPNISALPLDFTRFYVSSGNPTTLDCPPSTQLSTPLRFSFLVRKENECADMRDETIRFIFPFTNIRVSRLACVHVLSTRLIRTSFPSITAKLDAFKALRAFRLDLPLCILHSTRYYMYRLVNGLY